ncbi:mobile mystery protein B [Aliidiomarina halalkaliphila]|uniref:Mobile mystery protein B n=1 Tax=Aliidiomarina halalkaliphila TaxID=2593535 RepID=A0A552X1Y7_9GAMM|nr:mobile mystery protein B [Aliidiomarina halalkaliphila]
MFKEPDGATPLDPNETQGLKFQHITTRAELNELEQANIEQGLRWVSRRRGGSVFDDHFIRTLHKRLFGDVWTWAGAYRRTEKTIGIDPQQISVQLRILLDNIQYWIAHSVYPPLDIAARFHHRLVQIHLFPNGNGRHARIATDILLEDVYKLPPIPWASGYDLEYDNQRRKEYITALRAADCNDFTLLLKFVERAK